MGQRIDVRHGIAHPPLQQIKRHNRRDGDEQSHGGGDQRFEHARHHRVRIARSASGAPSQIVSRLDDAKHRTEEPNERRIAAAIHRIEREFHVPLASSLVLAFIAMGIGQLF